MALAPKVNQRTAPGLLEGEKVVCDAGSFAFIDWPAETAQHQYLAVDH
jgi:hypothetical protein